MLAQISLGREGHFTEAALCYWLLLVLVFTAHFTNVFLQVRQSSEQVAAHVALERAEVVMAGPDVHGDRGVVTESHATPVVLVMKKNVSDERCIYSLEQSYDHLHT